uniref:Uncharacterized protein n=2 Tax=Dunaliella tertiolecta TaxID=3047 RepID=A0A7S3R0A7_DUNTE
MEGARAAAKAQEEQLAAQAVRLSTCQAEADARAQQLLAEHQAYRAAAEATERQLAAELGSSRAAAEQGMQQLQADLEEAQAAAEASMRQLLEEAEASRAAADARQKQVEAVMEGARQAAKAQEEQLRSMKERFDASRAEAAHLAEEAAAAQAQAQAAQAEKATVEGKLEAVMEGARQAAKAQEQQLNGQRKRAEAYRAEADALNEQLSALQAQLQTVSAERAALDIRASVADRAVQQLRSELDDSRALLAEGAVSHKADADERAQQLQAALEGSKSQAGELQRQLQAAKEVGRVEVEAVQQKLQAAESSKASLEELVQQVQSDLEASRAAADVNLRRLQGELAAAQDQAREQAQQLQEQQALAHMRASDAERDLAHAHAQLREAETTAAALQARVSEGSEEVAQLREEVLGARRAMQEHEGQLSSLEQLLVASKAETAEATRQLAEAKAQLTAGAAERAQQEDRSSILSADASRAEAAAAAEIAALRSDLDAHAAEKAALEASGEVARLEAARLGGLLRGAVSKLEASMSQASQAQGSRAAAEEAAKSAQARAEQASAECRQVEGMCQELAAQLSQATDAHAELQISYATLRAEHDTLLAQAREFSFKTEPLELEVVQLQHERQAAAAQIQHLQRELSVALAAQTKQQAAAHRRQMASLPPPPPPFVHVPSPSRPGQTSRRSSNTSSSPHAQRDPSEAFAAIYGLPFNFEAQQHQRQHGGSATPPMTHRSTGSERLDPTERFASIYGLPFDLKQQQQQQAQAVQQAALSLTTPNIRRQQQQLGGGGSSGDSSHSSPSAHKHTPPLTTTPGASTSTTAAPRPHPHVSRYLNTSSPLKSPKPGTPAHAQPPSFSTPPSTSKARRDGHLFTSSPSPLQQHKSRYPAGSAAGVGQHGSVASPPPSLPHMQLPSHHGQRVPQGVSAGGSGSAFSPLGRSSNSGQPLPGGDSSSRGGGSQDVRDAAEGQPGVEDEISRLASLIRHQREQIASFIGRVADKKGGSEESQTQIGQLTANLAAMKALNTELLAKVSRSRAGGDAAGDSAALVQELKDILASSKAEEAPADEDPLAAPPSDAAALVVHASYLSAKIKDVVQRQWQVIRRASAHAPGPSAHPNKTTDELPHPHASGDRGVGGGAHMQRQLRSTMSRRLSFDGTDQPSSRSNSIRARAPVVVPSLTQSSELGIGGAHGGAEGRVDVASMSQEAAQDFESLQTQYCNLLLQFWHVEVQLKNQAASENRAMPQNFGAHMAFR